MGSYFSLNFSSSENTCLTDFRILQYVIFLLKLGVNNMRQQPEEYSDLGDVLEATFVGGLASVFLITTAPAIIALPGLGILIGLGCVGGAMKLAKCCNKVVNSAFKENQEDIGSLPPSKYAAQAVKLESVSTSEQSHSNQPNESRQKKKRRK